jgi:hypothetical protein
LHLFGVGVCAGGSGARLGGFRAAVGERSLGGFGVGVGVAVLLRGRERVAVGQPRHERFAVRDARLGRWRAAKKRGMPETAAAQHTCLASARRTNKKKKTTITRMRTHSQKERKKNDVLF